METRLHSKFVHSAFAAAIFSLLSGTAGAQAPSWSLTGNAGTDPLTNFLGTRDGKPLVIQPGSGNVGIGTTTPEDKLTIVNGRIMFANTELSKAGRMGVDELGVWIELVDPTSGIRLNASEHAIGLYLAADGTVGIGSLAPAASDPSLHIVRNNNDINLSQSSLTIENATGSQSMQYFSFGGVEKASIRADSNGNLVFNANSSTYYLGRDFGNPNAITIVPQSIGRTLTIDGNLDVGVLRITGGSDLAEPFAMDEQATIEPGLVVAIDPVRPGQLRLADRAYDRTVAGIVSGANGINPGLTMTSHTAAHHSRPVALSGRVYVWADASHDPIQPGDLLTTSDTPGHAMKVTDYARAQGAVLGKAMSALAAGKGLILVLVTLQ
jgi:hypothetical protein